MPPSGQCLDIRKMISIIGAIVQNQTGNSSEEDYFMHQKDSTAFNFESAPLARTFFRFTLPVVLAGLISVAYNMVDTYFIALTGNTTLIAGVSLISPVFTLLIAIGDVWGLGGSSYISRLFGEKKFDQAKKISSFVYWGSLLFGVLVTVLLLGFQGPILRLLGASTDTFSYAQSYYFYIALGAPLMIFPLVPNNTLRAEGFTTASLFGTIIGAIVNIILDPVLIFGFELGASGAAIATVLGNASTDLFYLYYITKKSRRMSIDPRLMRISGRDLLMVLSIGIPGGLTNMMSSFAGTLLNRSILPYGTDAIAALGIANKVNMITIMVMVGFGFGAQPLIGYAYGARNRERLSAVIRFNLLMESAVSLTLMALIMLFSRPLIRIFIGHEDIINFGAEMLRILQCGMLFQGIVLVITCVFQSIGRGTGAPLLSIGRQGIFLYLLIKILSSAFGYYGVLFSQPVSDILTAALAALLYLFYRSKDPVMKKKAK